MIARPRRYRVTVGIAVVLAVTACHDPAPPESAPPVVSATTASDSVVLSAAARTRSGVTVALVQRRLTSDRIVAPGLIALDETRTARVGSLQEGLVLNIHAEVGSHVRAGQLLATMHGHAVHDAWAGYRKAVADRRRLEKELAYAVEAAGRAQRLYTSKSISLQERQRAEVEAVVAKEQLAMAEAEVVRSIEELEHVGITVDERSSGATAPTGTEQIPVKTPLSGVVLQRLVTPGTTVTPGTPMFVVSELSTLWAVAEVDESHLARLQVGRPVGVSVAAYAGEQFPGTISFIADMVNPKTRRIAVRATVPNPDGRLKPEMFASITLGESESRQALVVPRDAVQTVDARDVVFVETAPDRFTVRPVALGTTANEGTEIVEGLADGERVAVTGSFVLKSELLKARGESGE